MPSTKHTLYLLGFFATIICDINYAEAACDAVKPDENAEKQFPDFPDVYGFLDQTEVLPCLLEGVSSYSVQWVQDGIALGEDASLPDFPRYRMAENNSLIIENVTKSDQAKYACQVAICGTQSNPINFIYAVALTGPYVTNKADRFDSNGSADGYLEVIANKNNIISCTVNNSKPNATVDWHVPAGFEVSVLEMTTLANGDETFNTIGSISLSPATTDSDALFLCLVESVAGNTQYDVYLQVLVQPTVPQPVIPSGELLLGENENKILSCKADLAEPMTTLTWYRNRADRGVNQSTVCGNGLCNVSSSIQVVANSINDGAMYECILTTDAFSEPLTISYYIIKVNYPVDAAVIAGSVVGCVVFLILLFLLIFCLLRRKKKKKGDVNAGMEFNSPESYENKVAIDNDNLGTTEEDIVPAQDIPLSEDVAAKGDGDDQSNTSDETTDESAYYGTSDEESDAKSAKLPGGETFSISSSILVSDRGSPVMFNNLDENDIPNNDINVQGYRTQRLHHKQITDV